MNELPLLPVENYIDDDGLWAERQGPYTADQMRAYAAAAVAAAVPPGWKVVPVEPTQEMVECITECINLMHYREGSRAGWKAALAAAPEVPR